MTAPKKIAFYIRVSTAAQDYASQRHALTEFCRRSGWTEPGKKMIFAEKITGKIARRTQLDLLLQACRDGHVDTILVYRADRMGNSAQHMHNLIAELDALKIRVVGVADGVDTAINNSATVTYRNMLIGFSEGARMLIRERTVAGLKAARAQGRVGGRPLKDGNAARFARALKLRPKWTEGHRALARHVGLDAGNLLRFFKKADAKK